MSETKPQTVKEILLALLADVQDLRSSQGLLFERLSPQVSIADALAHKNATASATNNLYRNLRAAIEALP